MKLAVSFPIGILGDIDQNEFYKQMYTGLTEIVKEEDVCGVQVYPSQWPRKVLISLKDLKSKQALLLSGINIRGQNIELKDESLETTKITLRDALIEWNEDKIREILSPYGEIHKVDNEHIYIDGKKTGWLTGTRFIYMSNIHQVIPNRLTTTDGDKQVTTSVWYRRPFEKKDKCFKCGGQHDPQQCTFQKKVCFKCNGDHIFKDCPLNDGSRVGENIFCFMTEKSPLSNFNMKYPIQINGTTYSCNEQYIQSQKSDLFGDNRAKARIMASNDPREMKDIGRRIRGYVDSEWKAQTDEVIMECLRRKVYDHKAVQDYLLSTGDKIIGEATPDRHFGIGLHIGDSRVLNYDEWQGRNLMGRSLMEIRREIKFIQEVREEPTLTADMGNSLITSTPGATRNPEHEPMRVSPILNPQGIQGKMPTSCQNNDSIAQTLGLTNSAKNCAILLGDTNANGLSIDNPDYEVTKICKAEATVQDVSDLMENCPKDPKDVNAVLFQLGTCNWSTKNTDNIETNDSVYRSYVEALNSASSKYPYAELLVSSVPQRLPQGIDDIHNNTINAEIAALNNSLRMLADEEDNVIFIDNDIDLTKNGVPDVSLYADTDKTGVHLNSGGLALVSSNLSKGLSNLFFNSTDDAQWHTK